MNDTLFSQKWQVTLEFRKKDYLDHEVTSLHSGLFQAKFAPKLLEKLLQASKLSASRTVSVYICHMLVNTFSSNFSIATIKD